MSMMEREIKNLQALKETLLLDKEMGRTKCSGYAFRNRIEIIDSAIETIKELSEKVHVLNMERSTAYYNDGWIPCAERMPEEHESEFYRLKDSEFKDYMWKKQSVLVLVTRKTKEGKEYTSASFTKDGAWDYETDLGAVVAWIPLPEPYKGGDIGE